VYKKHKKFKFGPQVLIRLIIFFVIIIFSIRYLSNSNNFTPINFNIPYIDNYLPSISNQPAIISIQNKINQIRYEGSSLIDKQIKEIKKIVIKKTADELIKNIDQQ